MFHNFNEIEKYILDNGIKKRIALCGAHDEASLSAVIDAKRKGVIEAMLIGEETVIKDILKTYGEAEEEYQIVNEPNDNKGARLAFKAVAEGEADIPMKGNIQTTSFMAAMVNPLFGIIDYDGLMTHTTAFYYPPRNQFVFASDTSFTMAPTLEEKVQIINNAARLMKDFGYDEIKVGVISAVEFVKDNIPSTLDAKALSEMEWGEGIVVDGPFALDNALDEEAARHKGIKKEIAGKANLLLLPDFLTGNILYKSLHFFGHLPLAGVVCGTTRPAIVASRTDEPEAKYNSILVAILQSIKRACI